MFVDYASSLNLTCLVISPNPPAYVFWKLTDKVSTRFSKKKHKKAILKIERLIREKEEKNDDAI